MSETISEPTSEPMGEQYHVRYRAFLNEHPELPAFVIAVVEDTRAIPDGDPKESWNDGTIVLDFGDCYRRVAFNFDMGDARERAHSLRKISKIAQAVNAMHEAIALEVESRNARPVSAEPVTKAELGTNETEQAKHEAAPNQLRSSYFTTLGL
jgi:hypothetical protein